jgi:hypothetical protein
MTAPPSTRNVRRVTTMRSPTFETGVRVFVGAEPSEAELPRVAGRAALFAAVPAALGTLGQDGGVRAYLPILVLIVLVTLGVFAWAVPSALAMYASGPSVVALTLSGLGLLTVLLFWTGLPAVLAMGGIFLARTQLDVPEDRFRARLAIKIGAAAIVLYLLVFVADFL